MSLERLLSGTDHDPHAVLGQHRVGSTWVMRIRRPDAVAVSVDLDGVRVTGRHVADGVFEVDLPRRLRAEEPVVVTYPDLEVEIVDPYRFPPTLGEVDLHLIGEGRHERLWEALGARSMRVEGVEGVAFTVWAPEARSVRVVGSWNSWDGRLHPMRSLGASGVWELFVPEAAIGDAYRFELVDARGVLRTKSDPMARQSEAAPGTASVVARSTHVWGDGDWMGARAGFDPVSSRCSIYEVHAGSWRRAATGTGDRPLSWGELAGPLADHVIELGFTHVELLPVAEHPYTPSWGYQVTGYFAPTARYGSPDDFRAFVDELHRRGIGVILDWVPAHFPKDEFALVRFDGTALYEHEDPRKGDHPDWGTHVFNYGRNEVRNFLIANALYWFEEFHVDGLRVDAVASMLYLDYSRAEGEWVANRSGGRENLEAIDFMRELNSVVYRAHPGVWMIAEESTAWDGVSRPVHAGGLGFGHKWNMGWMHDTLAYFAEDPVHRQYHHDRLTFGLVYAWSEHFVLPLSHDEVVHGKGSLLTKMPGDRWQQLANLRSLLAWMWAHPGKQLLFMGAEMAQEREWSADRELDWHLLDDEGHAGVRAVVAELNRLQAAHPALWERDTDPGGFHWLEAADAGHSVFAFERRGHAGAPVICVANLTPVPRHGYRVGLAEAGAWTCVMDTDDSRFGGSGFTAAAGLGAGTGSTRMAEPIPWQGRQHSLVFTLPPLAVLWIVPGA